MWFQATVVGQFPIYCTQYCGAGHSDMLSSVFVHEPGGYEKWLANAASQAEHLPPPEAGLHLYKTRGCASCHTIDGSRLVGPSFKGVFGHQVPLSDGTSVMADENYVRESILAPAAKVVRGYEPVMPTYQGRITDKEIDNIIAFLKTLQ